MRQSNKMRIVLKKDWDININPPTDNRQVQGFFVGRKKELKLLTNEILRRTSGAILISGYRGVGKTSLVYKALWEAKNEDKNIIVVLLNAAQLEAEAEQKSENSKIHPRKIIENLIRRLYSSTKDINLPNDIKEDVTKLYKKAVAKEFRLLENYQRKQEFSRQAIKEKAYEILLNEANIKIMIFLTSWAIAVALQFTNTSLTPWTSLNKLIPLILAFPLPYAINLWYRKKLNLKELKE
ncbi:MAG TPA: ATP-binding protein, partial [Candidatus Altiarchaeales archaeon]|nr:ATP-binding protein [Candidatus Altiarchaeales archaeon]